MTSIPQRKTVARVASQACSWSKYGQPNVAVDRQTCIRLCLILNASELRDNQCKLRILFRQDTWNNPSKSWRYRTLYSQPYNIFLYYINIIREMETRISRQLIDLTKCDYVNSVRHFFYVFNQLIHTSNYDAS